MKGIVFKLNDGTKEWFDPLNEDDLTENEDDYILDMVYSYTIPKKDVESYEWYDLCNLCGYELGTCNCEDEQNDTN